MYRPRGNGQSIQQGGLYVSTAPNNLLLGVMTSSMLSTLMAETNLSNFGDLANLSIDKINNLIASVTTQLENEVAIITQTDAAIASATLDINRAGGLQDKFNTADWNLTIAQMSYKTASTLFAESQAALDNDTSTLMQLSSAKAAMQSTVDSYNAQYISLMGQIAGAQATVDAEQDRYDAELAAFNQNGIDRANAQRILLSTINAREYASTLYDQVLENFVSTSTVAYTMGQSYIQYSTGTYALTRMIAQSTAMYYSSLLQEESRGLQLYMSTSTALHIAHLNYSTALTVAQYDQALLREMSTIMQYDQAKLSLSTIDQILTPPYTAYVQGTAPSLTPQQQGVKDFYYPNDSLAQLAINAQYYTVLASNLSSTLYSATTDRQLFEAARGRMQLITLQAMIHSANQNIQQSQQILFDAQANERNVISTISTLSSNIRNSYLLEYYYVSTLNSISTNYHYELARWYNQSSIVGMYDIRHAEISRQIASTLQTIQSLMNLSTMYNLSVSIYQSSYSWYSTLDAITQSSITGYTIEDDNIQSTIRGISADITILGISTITAVGDLRLYQTQFYNYKLQELILEAQQYQYSVQELNAVVGASAAQLLLNKLALYTQIDTLNLALVRNPNDSAASAQRQNLMSQQTTIQTIINAINPLDEAFNAVVKYSLNEQQYKNDFISARSNLSGIEIDVLNGDSVKADIKDEYLTTWATMNGSVTSANSAISQKNALLFSIYSVLNVQIPQITTLYPTMTFPTTITVGQTPLPLQSSDPNQAVLSDFAILPPIDFTTP